MSRSLALVVALLGLGTALPAGNAVAAQTLKDQLVGTGIQAVATLPKISFEDHRKMTRPDAERSFVVAQRRCPNGRC